MVESIDELRKICQSHKKLPASEIFHRKISIYLTKLFLHTAVTANQITYLAMLLGIIVAFLFLFNNFYSSLLAVLLFQLWALLDYVDGEIARYRGTSSILGLYLDRLNTSLVTPLIFLSISFRVYFELNNVVVFAFGFSSVISILLFSLVTYNMYISAVDFYLKSKRTCFSEVNASQTAVNTDTQEDFVSSHTIMYNFVDFLFPGSSPGLIWVLLFSVIIEQFIPRIVFGSYIFNAFYLVLITYGVCLPSGLIVLLFIIIRNKKPEKIYGLIIKHSYTNK